MAYGWQNSCQLRSCNYLQNVGATTYKKFLQFYAKKACKKHIRDPDVNGYMTVSKEQGDNILYGLMDSKGEMVIPLQYDIMRGFDENGGAVVGMRRSDSDKDVDRYYCKYINKDNQVIFKLPDKYINAWAFVRVN